MCWFWGSRGSSSKCQVCILKLMIIDKLPGENLLIASGLATALATNSGSVRFGSAVCSARSLARATGWAGPRQAEPEAAHWVWGSLGPGELRFQVQPTGRSTNWSATNWPATRKSCAPTTSGSNRAEVRLAASIDTNFILIRLAPFSSRATNNRTLDSQWRQISLRKFRLPWVWVWVWV